MTIGGVGSNSFQAATTNDTQTTRASKKKPISKRIAAFFLKQTYQIKKPQVVFPLLRVTCVVKDVTRLLVWVLLNS